MGPTTPRAAAATAQPTALDRMSASSKSVTLPLQRRRLLLRRERDHRQQLEDQVARGRPDTTWRRCGDETCSRPGCGYDVMSGTVRDRETSENGDPVRNIFRMFADEIVSCIWPSECLGGSRDMKHRAVEAFATSPPTRSAFLQFRRRCSDKRLRPSETEMRKTLASLLPELRPKLPAAESLVHAGGVRGSGDDGQEELLRDAAIEFIVGVEVWRRFENGRFRDWAFGERGESAEGLAALLFHLWLMDREGCFEAEQNVSGRRCDELWQEWLDEHPVTSELDEEGGAEKRYQGVGRGARPWRGPRMDG